MFVNMMKHIRLSFWMVFFLFFSLCAKASEFENQQLCIQKTVAACMNQCEKNNTVDCSEACQEQAQNQCIEAGE